MKKTLPLFLSVSILVLSSCGNAKTPEKYTGPNWINAQIEGELAKHDRPEAKDDFFSYVNYEAITSMEKLPENVSSSGGLLADSAVQTEQAIAKLLTEETSTPYSSELLKLRDYITNGDINYLKEQFQWWMDGPDEHQVNDYFSKLYTNLYWNSLFDLDTVSYDHPVLYPGGYTFGKLGIFYAINRRLLYEYDKEWYADYKDYQSAVNDGLRFLYTCINIDESQVETLVNQEIAIERKIARAFTYGYGQTIVGNPSVVGDFISTYPIVDALAALGYTDNDYFYITPQMSSYLIAVNNLTVAERNLFYGTRFLLSYSLCIGLENYKILNNTFYAKTELSSATLLLNDDNIIKYLAETYFPQYIDVAYSQANSSRETKNIMMNLISDVLAEYRTMLSEEEWLSETTRSKAIEKLDYMTYDAMYPDEYSNFTPAPVSSSLSEFLTGYLNNYYQNLLENNIHILWRYSPTYTNNAFYTFGYNRFQVYQGLYQAFDFTNYSLEELYSQVAMVIGHEITHGFDANGAMYDKDGEQNNWWTTEDYDRFDEKVEKVIKYFDNIKLKKGTYCKGALVNTEATADMGGMKVALRLAKKVENFDYHKFFESYAKVFHFVVNNNSLDKFINDEHPFPYLRINVTCAQFDEFIETYGIQEGDEMYIAPEDRITVW